MPTLVLFNIFENKDAMTAVIGFISGIAVLIVPYILQRRKLQAEIHKTDMEAVSLGIQKILDLMKVVEVAHKKALEDEKKIVDLMYELKVANNKLKAKSKDGY